MRIHLRLDQDGQHVQRTLFIDGANCGQLVMLPLEDRELCQLLAHGQVRMNKELATDHLVEIDRANLSGGY